MRIIWITASLCVALALSTVLAAGASFGLTTQFLRSGSMFAAEYLISAEGKLLLEEPVMKPDIECEMTQAESDIKVLSATDADWLSLELLNCKAKNLGGAPCTMTFDGLRTSGPIEFWLITVALVDPANRGTITKGESTFAVPGWSMSCEAIGIKFSALCELLLGEGGAEDYSVGLKNLESGGLEAIFEGAETAKCTTGGTQTVEAKLTLLDSEGLALAISEA